MEPRREWLDSMQFQILIVEDAEADVYLVREALGNTGLNFDLSVMDDGEKAMNLVEALDRDPNLPLPDLILLDLNLPRKSGGQVLERLRRSGRLKDLPVVILTSSEAAKDRATATQLKATGYFHKPSSLDEFMRLGGLVRDLLAPPEAGISGIGAA